MPFSKKLSVDPVRTLAAGMIAALYTVPVGTPFGKSVRQMIIQNLTDETVIFSMSTINTPNANIQDHFPLISNGYLVLDVSSNSINDGGWFISGDTTIYVRHGLVAPTTGAVWVTIFYGQGD